MNPRQTVEKLTGHNKHLLTYFLSILRKYELIRPMLSSNELSKKYGGGSAGQGFHILKMTMFLSVVQDVAKIVFDGSKKTPSLKKIIEALENDGVVELLEKKYVSAYEGEDLPDEIKDKFKSERLVKFREYLDRAMMLYKHIAYSSEAESCRIARDKYTAHLELKFIDGEYRYPDISEFKLSWGIADQLLIDIKELVSLLTMIIRDADFAWESFEYHNKRISDKFWAT
jgi:ribosomal protein S19E (S16A)